MSDKYLFPGAYEVTGGIAGWIAPNPSGTPYQNIPIYGEIILHGSEIWTRTPQEDGRYLFYTGTIDGTRPYGDSYPTTIDILTGEEITADTHIPGRPYYPVTIDTFDVEVTTTYIPGRVEYPGQEYQPPTPAVPPTPSSISVSVQEGWNAGARSIPQLLSDGRAEFKAPVTTVGCVAGLNGSDEGPGYVEIEHAWYVSKGKAKILERGVEVYDHGAFADGALFAVERISSVVSYKVDGIVVYTSAVASIGTVFLDASLYIANDYIYSPAIIDYAPGPGDTSPGSVAAIMEPCLCITSEYVYGVVVATALPCESFISGGLLAPEFNAVVSVAQFCLGIAQETNLDTNDGVTAVMLPCESLAYADVEFVLSKCLPCTNVAYERTLVDMDHDTFIPILDLWYQPAEKIAIVNSDMSMAAVLSWDVFIESLLDSEVTITTGLSTIGDAALLIDTIVQLGFGVPVLSSDNQVWVVNEAGQMTRYEGYPFNSFCQIGPQYYGAREDGIYLLEGDTDAGSPIRASINLGKVDFGTTLMKHVPNCYIGVASDDRMYLKVISNGQEYIYSARSSSDQMQTQRFDIGRGLRSNFMIFELLNKDGCDFELGSIEFIAIPSTSRRI